MPHAYLLAACALLAAAGATGPAQDQPASRGVSLDLLEVREIRVGAVRPRADDSFLVEREGLKLTLSIRLARGLKLVELQEPTSINAVDSAGTDLTNVEPGFSGEPEYIDVVHAWEGDAKLATLTLAAPKRAAAAFSVQAQIGAVVCAGSTPASVQAGPSAGPLATGVAGFPEATIQIRPVAGSAQVTITPGTVRPWIESIALVSGGVEHESNSSMWTDASVSYTFDAPAPANATVRLMVRRDLRTLPVAVDLAQVALP